MMKKTYINPKLDLIIIGDKDIITNSTLIDGSQDGEEVTLPNIGDWMNG